MVPNATEAAQPLALTPGSPELSVWLMLELVLVSVWLTVLCGGLVIVSPGLAGCWGGSVELPAWPESELPSVGLASWLSNVSQPPASWPAATSPS